MNTKVKLFKLIYGTISKSSVSLLIIICICLTSLLPATNFSRTPNQTVSGEEINIRDEGFDKKFREGRDLIDKGEWAMAAEKFSEAIAGYPDNKSVDAALYWLAYCHKRQKKFKEMEVALDRLLKEFPASSWADDAKVMKLEIPKPSPANQFDQMPPLPNAAALPSKQDLPDAATLPTLFDKPLSFDRETEIKIVAFKSLLSADPKRAVQIMGDILMPDSKAGETLKIAVMRALRKPFLLEEIVAKAAAAAGAGNQLIPSLREALIRSFQEEPNIKIRREIIYALIGLNDEQSINYLAKSYTSESNQEIKKAIINSFGDVFANVSTSLSRKIQFDKLVEIIRAEKDTELRRFAYSSLQYLDKWMTSKEKFADAFVQFYDVETDEQLKISIIRALGETKQNNAFKKLLEIAKSDKSDKLKLEAIYALRTSNNPEVLKFLEELIK